MNSADALLFTSAMQWRLSQNTAPGALVLSASRSAMGGFIATGTPAAKPRVKTHSGHRILSKRVPLERARAVVHPHRNIVVAHDHVPLLKLVKHLDAFNTCPVRGVHVVLVDVFQVGSDCALPRVVRESCLVCF
jgi:hypothetical protein